MPRIPFVQSEQRIPGTSGGTYAPMNDPVGQAITHAGNQMGQVVDQHNSNLRAEQRFEEHQKNIERQLKANSYETNLKTNRDILVESYKERSDYDKWFDGEGKVTGDLKNDLDKFRSSYESIDDPVLKNVVSRYGNNLSYDIEKTMRVKKTATLVKQGQGQWEVMKNEAIQDYANATPEERQAIEDTLFLKGAALEASLVLSPKQVEQDKIKFKSDAAKEYFKGLGSVDPIRAFNELKDTKEGSLSSHLSPIDRQNYLAALQPKVKEQQINAVAGELTKSFNLDSDTPDWEGAIKSLYKTDNLQRWGIDFKQSQQLFSDLRQRFELEKSTDKLLVKEKEDGAKAQFFDLVNKGKYKEAYAFIGKSGLDATTIYDLKQKVITDQRQAANFAKSSGTDNDSKAQKKAEAFILNHVKGEKVGYALQTFRTGITQFGLGSDRYEEYSRQVAAMPEYTKKTNKSGKLAAALGVGQLSASTTSRPLTPISQKAFKFYADQIKTGAMTRQQAETAARNQGWDTDNMEKGK